MTTIRINRDLTDEGSIANPTQNGWETYAASGFVYDVEGARYVSVTFVTGNYFAAFSVDGGPFIPVDPNELCQSVGESLCCDQTVVFDPQFGIFIWEMLTNAKNIVLAVARPEQFLGNGTLNWTVYLLKASIFDPNLLIDRPVLAVGAYFVYLTFNLGSYSVGIRILLSDLAVGGNITFPIYRATSNFWMRPVKNTGSTGFFVAEDSSSQLHVFAWPAGGTVSDFSVKIASIPTEDFATPVPSGDTWLAANSKIDWQIQGATMSGNQMWIVWSGARRISGQQQNTFPYPHIGVAVIDVVAQKLVGQYYIWNPTFGFAWPDVATNINGDVGLSCCVGGPDFSPQHAVAMLTGSSIQELLLVFGIVELELTTSGTTGGAGGHYTSIQRSFASWSYYDGVAFAASGFNQIVDGSNRVNHPHYVEFTY